MIDSFLPLLASVVDAKRDHLRHQLALTRTADDVLGPIVQRNWHALPSVTHQRRGSFAIDGSSFVAGLADGSHLMIGQAVLVGQGGVRDRALSVECVPGFVPVRDVELYSDALVRKLELELAVRNLPQCVGQTLYLDGSIYQNITQAVWAEHLRVRFMRYGANVEEFRLIDRLTSLVRGAPQHQVTLVAIAKTFQSALLQAAFAPERLERVGDATLLQAWTESAGYTTPLLLGQLFLDASTLSGRSDAAQAAAAARSALLSLPAVVVFYVRFEPFRLPVRVEVLADDVGLSELLGDITVEPTDADLSALFRQLFDDYVDDETYCVPLVAADTAVRLHQAEGAQQYVPIIGERLGLSLALNRSRRRFVSLVS